MCFFAVSLGLYPDIRVVNFYKSFLKMKKFKCLLISKPVDGQLFTAWESETDEYVTGTGQYTCDFPSHRYISRCNGIGRLENLYLVMW